jgi:hypothetical protein
LIIGFVTDKHMEKVVGEPYWGKPDIRFDEGAWETYRYCGGASVFYTTGWTGRGIDLFSRMVFI